MTKEEKKQKLEEWLRVWLSTKRRYRLYPEITGAQVLEVSSVNQLHIENALRIALNYGYEVIVCIFDDDRRKGEEEYLAGFDFEGAFIHSIYNRDEFHHLGVDVNDFDIKPSDFWHNYKGEDKLLEEV